MSAPRLTPLLFLLRIKSPSTFTRNSGGAAPAGLTGTLIWIALGGFVVSMDARSMVAVPDGLNVSFTCTARSRLGVISHQQVVCWPGDGPRTWTTPGCLMSV